MTVLRLAGGLLRGHLRLGFRNLGQVGTTHPDLAGDGRLRKVAEGGALVNRKHISPLQRDVGLFFLLQNDLPQVDGDDLLVQIGGDQSREERVVEIRFREERFLVRQEAPDGHSRLDLVFSGTIDVPFHGHDVPAGEDDGEHAHDVAVEEGEWLLIRLQVLGVGVEHGAGDVPLEAFHLDALLVRRRGEPPGHADQVQQRFLVPQFVDGGAPHLAGDRRQLSHHGDEDDVPLQQPDVGARVAGKEELVQIDLLGHPPRAQDPDAPQRPDVLHPAGDGERLEGRVQGADVVPAGGADLAHHGDPDALQLPQADVGADLGDGGDLGLEKGAHLLERLAGQVEGAELGDEDLPVPVDHKPVGTLDAPPHLDDDLVAGADDVAGGHGHVLQEKRRAGGGGEQFVAEV